MRKSWPWLLLGAASVFILVTRLQLSFDISAFFPRAPDLQHQVLLQQFQSGPGSRLLVIGINGAEKDTLAGISDELRFLLEEDQAFTAVMNGETSDESAGMVPEPVASYYLLMDDIDFSAEALAQAVRDRLQDLAFGGGSAMLELIARDPYFATLNILGRLAPVEMSGDMWFAADGSAVLMAETRATAVDIEAQAQNVAAVRRTFDSMAEAQGLTLEMTGAGVFGVELQKTIRAEAQKRSILATVALLIVLFAFFRRWRYLLLATVPIGMGFLVGLAGVSVIFTEVHGITLAFGFTLMGVAIDYPLHLFSHAERSGGKSAIVRIWPTMRLGAVSTAIAYVALAFSGSDGLAQLGVFTAAGITVALLVTKTWVPYFVAGKDSGAPDDNEQLAVPIRYLPAVGLAGIALVAISQVATDGLWDDRLTSLSPVPEARIADDNRLRSAAGTPDMRHQLFHHNPDLDALLERSEDVDRLLEAAVSDGVLDGWQSLTQILPSESTSAHRQAAIPDSETLQADLHAALAGTPFRENAFDAFLANAKNTRSLTQLTATDFDDSPLRSWRDAHLMQIGDEWVSLVSLRNPDAEALASRARDWGDDVSLLDLRDSSIVLMHDYRGGAIKTVAFAALFIVVLLWYQRRQPSQVLWIAMSVASGLVLTVAVVTAVHNQLTVIHLVALLLVAGLGLDYALFLSRTESVAERDASNKAVLACAVSTTVAFGILAGSSIPVLKFLGLTVAAGSASNYLVALAGTRSSKVG
jgi:predicted exporter